MVEQLALFSRRLAPPAPEKIVIHGSAEIDGPDDCYRWELRRWWAAGPYVCWVMLNPSTADASAEDPTLRTIIGFSRRWGYGGLVVVNLYPFRSSDPMRCRLWADSQASSPDAYWRNRAKILAVAADAALIMVAWGAAPWAQAVGDLIVAQLSTAAPDRNVYCLGTTADGAPKHPLARGCHRIPADQKPAVWAARHRGGYIDD